LSAFERLGAKSAAEGAFAQTSRSYLPTTADAEIVGFVII
jgi:hypothetical protein